MREWWVDEDALWLGSFIFPHDHDGSIPEKCVHVREVLSERDSATEALLREFEFLDHAELLDKICGARFLRAIKRFQKANEK